MPKWVHRLSDLDLEAGTATCAHCGPVKVRQHGKGIPRCCNTPARGSKGTPQTTLERNRRWRLANPNRNAPYRVHLGELCESCGFVPVHRVQLDLHHRDGDPDNNDPSNLQTLCANCHRLVTQMERGNVRKDYRQERRAA